MLKVKLYNKIAPSGLEQFPGDQYQVKTDIEQPDAILCRSQSLHEESIDDSVKAIARAGAGVNNIPVPELTKRGIVVFNTPGANANAVKELVISAMLLGSRNIVQGWDFMRGLSGSDSDLHTTVEQNKKQFIGFELAGRTLGVIGLGAIGVKVANAAQALGMEVFGYDPMISVQRAWELSARVIQADNVEQLLENCDIVSIHVPLVDATRNLINAQRLKKMQPGSMLINFARHGIVDDAALFESLEQEHIHAYVTDFVSEQLLNHPRVITLPHLGASTHEAEQNCAQMAVTQLRHFLEEGTIENSVNFPAVQMPKGGKTRVMVINENVPNMVAQISGILGKHKVNIVDLLNKSRDDVAVTVIDIEGAISEVTLTEIMAIEGVLSARII